MNTLIIGASLSGLASAACLRKLAIDFDIIEKQDRVAAPWHHHYERLHLHTPKQMSNLPYLKFDKGLPRYPDKRQVVDYLNNYQKHFDIIPHLGTQAIKIEKSGDTWITETNNGTFKSRHVIMATGAYSQPKPVSFPGMETFPGPILHSSSYSSGKAFKGKNVLVVGFGNSACEIAIDLYEQGAIPTMSVRSAVNIIPRDVLGIPVLEIAYLLSALPTGVADALSAPLNNLLIGNTSRLGLKKLPYGPLEEIRRDMRAPVLDIGTIDHIRKGHISLKPDIDYIDGSTIRFKDGRTQDFDAIVAGIGFYRDYGQFLKVGDHRFEDLAHPVPKQRHFGEDGLYFCGYWISPRGQIREIARDARQISRHIAERPAAS